ncbi:serine hydrolase [Paenibacillus barcinonensis]|uniref:Beta-lactamase n=1 Tax=Paenibacillus barcinonensis TaxID=198119 RepID=A0A2V4WGF6_PAEBA|nr:serine hydrolase [Paenibacillus barcinonensis]PYE51220.1 beta-lactamase [Paenibacillus barcinonensis]QKS55633.1 serine hydrolase [Paenibacillus barcinonensis]
MNLSSLQHTLEKSIPQLDLRSCLIRVRGEMLYKHYRNIQAETEIAKINSCTKSLISALICIAMDRGLLPEASTPISAFFPQLTSDSDPRKPAITLEQLLTMTAGFNWDEFGGQNSFPRMTRTDHWVAFAIEQRLRHEPGTHMEYNSGVSQILSSILMQHAGMSVAAFAERYLFGHLGIHDYEWEQDPQGVHTGGFGMKLLPADLLKFGQLFLQQGMWEGKRLISSELVQRSTQAFITVPPPNHGSYGWHWWVDQYEPANANENIAGSLVLENTSAEQQTPLHYYYARGFGGQYVYVVPELELVTVLTNDKRKKEKPPLDVFPRLIVPELWRLARCSGNSSGD